MKARKRIIAREAVLHQHEEMNILRAALREDEHKAATIIQVSDRKVGTKGERLSIRTIFWVRQENWQHSSAISLEISLQSIQRQGNYIKPWQLLGFATKKGEKWSLNSPVRTSP